MSGVFARWAEIEEMTGMSRPGIRHWVKNGIFPAPVHLGPKAIGWRRTELEAWAADPAGWASRPKEGVATREEWLDAVWSERGPRKTGTRAILITLTKLHEADLDSPIPDPGKERWEGATGLRWRTVRKHLLAAEEEGWLLVDRGREGDMYRLAWPKG